jgi:L-lactate dehydrogenase complex protein LldG
MSAAREQMLAAIRGALGRDRLPASTTDVLERRLKQPRANVVPERGRPAATERLSVFIAEAERVNATTERLATLADVPAAVIAYLRAGNLPAAVRAGTDALMAEIPWSREPMLQVNTGRAVGEDAASVTSAFAGIAETGTLMLLSDRESPTTLNFLPEAHLVVLPTDRIVGSYEDAWQRLRGKLGHGAMPRVVNWITGPSRTADIEQTLLLGAHGPKRLHILLVDGNGPRH